MALPTFIVIGAMKAGTSSLHHYLGLHPDIYMSDPKELDFFVTEKQYKRGLQWYDSMFPDKYQARGETSPNYSKFPLFDGVPGRIKAVLPEAKLIYIVRDPINRIMSHYFHNRAHGRETRTLEQALTPIENNHYITCSKYYLQLTRYLEYFPLEQMVIVTSEELKSDPARILERMFEFLGVDGSFKSEEFGRVLHDSGNKRRYTRWGRYLRDYGFADKVKRGIPEAIRPVVYKLVSRPFERVKLNDNLRQEIAEYLLDDVECLKRVIGREFGDWSLGRNADREVKVGSGKN